MPLGITNNQRGGRGGEIEEEYEPRRDRERYIKKTTSRDPNLRPYPVTPVDKTKSKRRKGYQDDEAGVDCGLQTPPPYRIFSVFREGSGFPINTMLVQCPGKERKTREDTLSARV